MQHTISDEKTSWVRKIALFFTSQTISLFGSSLVQFAIIWYITRETDSGMMVALSTVFAFLPQVLVSLFAGVWADRYNRKTLIVAADGSIACSTLVLAILMMMGNQNIWIMMVVSAIRSLGAGVQTPAVNALIPQIVPEKQLMRVNGINSTILSVVNLAAPAAGGAVLSYGPMYFVLLIDLVTAVVGIGILLFIRVPLHEKAKQLDRPDYFTDFKEGVRYAYSHSFIRKLLVVYAFFMILVVPSSNLNVLMVTRVFGDSYWYLTFNEISFFIGMTVGGIAIASWGGFKNRLVTLMIGSGAFGLGAVAIGLITSFPVYLGAMVLIGLTVPMLNTPVMSLLQEKVENDMQGRIFSFLQIASIAFMLIGMLVFGPLADRIPIQWMVIATGAVIAVMSFALLWRKSFMREGERPSERV